MHFLINIPIAIVNNIGFLAILFMVYQVTKSLQEKEILNLQAAYLFNMACIFQCLGLVQFILVLFYPALSIELVSQKLNSLNTSISSLFVQSPIHWLSFIAWLYCIILIALIFIGLPFVVRTVQPILEDLETELEEAASSLGANRLQIFQKIVFPILLPALLTGFALAFARAVGEYGSVVFIAGNIPMVSEITPLIIITKLEQYDYAGATAVASVMLLISFGLLLLINALQAWQRQRNGAA